MTQTQMQAPTRRLEQHIRLKAPVSRVYQALTDAKELQKWFPNRAMTALQPGGAWRFEFDQEDGCGASVVEGRYLELETDKLVRYSWLEPLEDGRVLANLTVQFRLVAVGDETDLYLEETGYGEFAGHDMLLGRRTNGWDFFLKNLASVLAGGPDDR